MQEKSVRERERERERSEEKAETDAEPARVGDARVARKKETLLIKVFPLVFYPSIIKNFHIRNTRPCRRLFIHSGVKLRGPFYACDNICSICFCLLLILLSKHMSLFLFLALFSCSVSVGKTLSATHSDKRDIGGVLYGFIVEIS